MDETGALHLRIAKGGIAQGARGWTCAEIALTTSLGYGSYEYTVRDTGHMEPAGRLRHVHLRLCWRCSENNREMDIEISQSFGDPANNKNAQYTVQPYYVAANVERYKVPAGRLIHSLTWQEGRATFRTVRGASDGSRGATIAEHTFTSGIPTPGIESARINLYSFARGKQQQKDPAEVVVEKFAYLP